MADNMVVANYKDGQQVCDPQHPAVSGRASWVLAQSAIAILLPPTTSTNTISAGGLITLTGIVLQNNYTYGLWVYLQAGDVVGGAAGLYWAVQTSNTTNATIQVYTNYQSPTNQFIPYIPSGTLTPVVGSGAALVDNSNADRVLVNVTVPGGLLGNNGGLRSTWGFTCFNSANAKAIAEKLAGTTFGSFSVTTAATGYLQDTLMNRGIPNAQYCNRNNQGWGSNATISAAQFLALDTTTDKAMTYTGNIATAGKATDFIVLERFCLEILPSL